MTFTPICKPFHELTPTELYDALQLRSDVFVVEQNCVFLDPDGKDQACYHLLLYKDTALIAYARLVPPGVAYAQMSIGRIITSGTVRGTGIGKQLVALAIEECFSLFGNGPIKIGAQLYAKAFYESFGFMQTGDVYDEDGIDHIHMIRES